MGTKPKRSTKPRAKEAARSTWRSVLKLWPKTRDGKLTPRDAGRVRRAFVAYRAELGLPDRCDIKDCRFHRKPLTWNGKKLGLILDHEDGNRFNNLPSNLRYLCPNCNSQSPWNGGKAKRRVIDSSELGWELRTPGGGREIGATGRATVTARAVAQGAWTVSEPAEQPGHPAIVSSSTKSSGG